MNLMIILYKLYLTKRRTVNLPRNQKQSRKMRNVESVASIFVLNHRVSCIIFCNVLENTLRASDSSSLAWKLEKREKRKDSTTL